MKAKYYVNVAEDVTDQRNHYDALQFAQRRTKGTVGGWGSTTIDGRIYVNYEVTFSTLQGARSLYDRNPNAYSLQRLSVPDKFESYLRNEILAERGTTIY